MLRFVGAWRLRSFNPLRGLAIVPLPFLYFILLVVAKRDQEMFVNELDETRDMLFKHAFIMLGALTVNSLMNR